MASCSWNIRGKSLQKEAGEDAEGLRADGREAGLISYGISLPCASGDDLCHVRVKRDPLSASF